MTTQNLKLRAPVPFPANVTGTGGIGVVKENGIWTISPDFGDIGTIVASAVTDPTAKQIWIWDLVTDTYNVLTLAGLGDALYKMTSTSSLLIATGSKTFVTQSGKDVGVGSWVIATSDADAGDYMIGQVTSYSGTSLVVNVTQTGGSGTDADWTIRASGTVGSTGPASGIKQAYSSATADADPGAGIFRLNNATPASATAAYLDNLDSGGATVSTLFDLMDDSTSTVRGNIRFERTTDPAIWAQFQVTGSVVDGTGYRKLTLANGAGSGAFTNGDAFAINFYRTGDGGTGDFSSNTASSVDGEMVLFSGTGGKTGKRSTLTGGILKSTSGVPAIAVAGTDYLEKSTSTQLAAGYYDAASDLGTKSSGTVTLDPTVSNIQTYTNGGAHTLAPWASKNTTMVVEITNNASAGAVTTSGWSKVDGDVMDTTNAHVFRCYCSVVGALSHLNIKRMA